MYSSESYSGGGQQIAPLPPNLTVPITLVIVDDNGNMSTQQVTPPSLDPIPLSSKIVCADRYGNISVMSPADVYAKPDNPAFQMMKGLLTIDASGNFLPVTTTRFNPCMAYRLNSDTEYSMHGTPGLGADGKPTCTCYANTNWDGHDPGKGCSLCDRTTTSTGLVAGQYGNYAGSNCQYSRRVDCNDHGKVNSSGKCTCDDGYVGSKCQYGPTYCSNRGVVTVDGSDNPSCVCTGGYNPATQCKDLICTYVSSPTEQSCAVYDRNDKTKHTTLNCFDASGKLSPNGTVFYGDYTCKTVNGFQQCGYANANPAPIDSAGNHDNQYAYGCPVLPPPVWTYNSDTGQYTRS